MLKNIMREFFGAECRIKYFDIVMSARDFRLNVMILDSIAAQEFS